MDRAAWLLAGSAILLWSSLASCAAVLRDRPPAMVAGLALAIGGMLSFHRVHEWKVPYATRWVGVGGILGYHLLYFAAFAHARDAVVVNLLNYLWPLLIVVLAPLVLRRTPWSGRHLLAAGCGLVGAALALAAGGFHPQRADALGYAFAATAALVWALYSLMTRRLPAFPTAAVGGFCLVSGAGALAWSAIVGEGLAAHVAALRWWEWLIILGMGLGPMGAAFFCWDAALKRGDPRTIGALAYATPLLSTLLLCIVRREPPSWLAALAVLPIVGGALLAARAPQAGPERATRATRRTTRAR